MDENKPLPQEAQPEEIPSDPVSLAKQIKAIESNMKEEIHAIQEVLSMLVGNKLTLDKIKSMTKGNLKKLADGQTD